MRRRISLRETTVDIAPAGGNPEELHDERALMGKTAGGLWLLAAGVTAAGQLLPGAATESTPLLIALIAVISLYGVASLTGLIPWDRTPMWGHALGSGTVFLFIPAALWLTGGANSYVLPLLVCALMFVAFFFPPRFAWPLAIELVLLCATPLLYDDGNPVAYLPRLLALAGGFVAVTWVMGLLKRRLVEAEARQRQIATEDALTGIANRRAFDRALHRDLGARGTPESGHRAADRSDGFAVLFFDLDDFKAINDDYGHPVGDTVLCEVAARAAAVVRPSDLLARIGGDEFALIAPGAGNQGARRLAEAIADAVATVRPATDSGPLRATLGWALYPDDGDDATSLMQAADRRLHERKRGLRQIA
jgi:diguanylate cyclase (GGDEF)-like protein